MVNGGLWKLEAISISVDISEGKRKGFDDIFQSILSEDILEAESLIMSYLPHFNPFPGHPWLSSASPAFEGVEALVMTVRSISFMVDSTYQALHSSFNVILSVADHFAKLKTHMLSLLSSLSLLKLFKWILDQFLTFLQLKQSSASPRPAIPGSSNAADADCAAAAVGGASVAAVAPFTTPAEGNGAASSHWPLIAFFGLALGAPWLLWKMTQSARTAESSSSAALWSGTNKNRDVSTGPLARPLLVRSHRSLVRLLRTASRPPLRSPLRSLAHFAHSLAPGKVNF